MDEAFGEIPEKASFVEMENEGLTRTSQHDSNSKLISVSASPLPVTSMGLL